MKKGFGDKIQSKKYKINKISDHKLIEKALKLHAEGELNKATLYYKECINRNLNNSDIFYNYGIILYELNNFKEAEIYTKKAIKIKPNFDLAYNNLGNIQRELKKFSEAEIAFLKSTEISPDNNIFYFNLGNIQKYLKKYSEAEISFLKSIKINPNIAEVYNNLGNLFKEIGNYKEAKNYLLLSIKKNPSFAEAYNNFGSVLKELDNNLDAEINFKKAIELKYNYPIAHNNLGTIFLETLRFKEAELSFKKAIELNPKLSLSYSNLGNALMKQGSIEDAKVLYQKAIKLEPYFADAHNNLGNLYKNIGEIDNAKISFQKAIDLKPDFPLAYYNFGLLMVDSGNYNEAIVMFEKAISYKKDYSLAKSELIHTKGLICDWSKRDLINEWIIDLGIKGSSINPLSLFYSEDIPSKHLKRAINFHREYFYSSSIKLPKNKNSKIHIGYFSADFREHPTMFLINALLKLHDKTKFKVILYSFAPKQDSYTNKAKNLGCIFKDIKKLNEHETVKMARLDKLDIAIDLMGYIEHNRNQIFSLRVAPIQINYLGYPGSLGSKCFDYILGDETIMKKEDQKFYTEKILRIPHSYQCNSYKKDLFEKKITRKDFDLPEEGFLFACFNANKKITPVEFDIWMRLLQKVDKSIIWLYESNQFATENLKKEAEKRNVSSDRLFFGKRLPFKEHMERYKICDLFLDTFNYNGHTTTSDALWAGLPVLTKQGNSFSSRVSSSFLNCLGINELITKSKKDYEEKALFFSKNNEELLEIKKKLRKSNEKAPFFNSKLFTNNLEKIFLDLVKN